MPPQLSRSGAREMSGARLSSGSQFCSNPFVTHQLIRFLTFCLLLAVISPHAWAQAGDSKNSMQLRFLVFGKIAGATELRMVDPDKPESSTKVELRLNNFTGPYTAKSRRLVLVEDGQADGAPIVPVLSQMIPASLGRKVLVVLVPQAKPKTGYRALPMRDDRVGFSAGQRRFVNLTPYPIGGEFDGKRSLIKANAVTSLKIPSPPSGRDTHEVAIFFQKQKKWLPLTSTVWPYDPELRSLVFFYWSPAEKRIRIQSIAEVPPAEEEDNG